MYARYLDIFDIILLLLFSEELAHKSREERMKLNQQKVKHWWDEDMGAVSNFYESFLSI